MSHDSKETIKLFSTFLSSVLSFTNVSKSSLSATIDKFCFAVETMAMTTSYLTSRKREILQHHHYYTNSEGNPLGNNHHKVHNIPEGPTRGTTLQQKLLIKKEKKNQVMK